MDEEIIFRIDIPQESITSLENLTKANKALREERKKLNLETADGQKRAQEINKQLDANTNIIKANSSALEKQRLNVGNYTGALDKLVPGLGATVTGFQGMTKSALAFIATPIGLVIAALGVALGSIMSYLKGTEEGQHKLNKIMDVGSAVIGKFSDLVSFLGGTLFKALAAGFETIIGFLNKWVPGFSEATEALGKFLNLDTAAHISAMEEERVALNRLLITERGRLKAEIEAAKLRAESTKDVKLRTAALAEVEQKTNELFDKELKLATLERDLAKERAAQAPNDIAANDALAESQAKLDDISRQRFAALKENSTKQLAVNEQSRMALEKERDEVVKLANEENIREGNKVLAAAAQEERHQRELEQINERIQAYVSEEEIMRRRIEVLDLESDLADESADANADYTKEVKKLAVAEQFANMVTQARIGLLGSISNVFRVFGDENRALAAAGVIAQKAAAISQIVSNTGIANAKAVAVSPLTFGQPFVGINSISAGISVAATIAEASKALSQITKAAGGGSFMTKGPTLLMVGDNPGGVERIDVTPISGKGRTVVGDGMIKMAGGGSLITGSVARQSESSSFQMQIFDAISRMRPIVTVEDINVGQSRVEVVESRAQVL